MITIDLPSSSAHAASAESYLPALRAFFARAQKAVALHGQVSVLLTSDNKIRRLNREFRSKDQATDVLSFPAPVFTGKKSRTHPQQPRIAGDLAISVETTARQAQQQGHLLQVELKILLLHGLLHLAGHDHQTDAGEMAALEDQLRRRFRLPHALIARSMQPGPPAKSFSRSRGRV